MALPATKYRVLALSRHLPLPQVGYFLDNPTHCSISIRRLKLTLNENFQPARIKPNFTFTDCFLPDFHLISLARSL